MAEIERMAEAVATKMKSVVDPLALRVETLTADNVQLVAKVARLESQLAEIQKDYLAYVSKGLQPHSAAPFESRH
jgi:hypothetical protein